MNKFTEVEPGYKIITIFRQGKDCTSSMDQFDPVVNKQPWNNRFKTTMQCADMASRGGMLRRSLKFRKDHRLTYVSPFLDHQSRIVEFYKINYWENSKYGLFNLPDMTPTWCKLERHRHEAKSKQNAETSRQIGWGEWKWIAISSHWHCVRLI